MAPSIADAAEPADEQPTSSRRRQTKTTGGMEAILDLLADGPEVVERVERVAKRAKGEPKKRRGIVVRAVPGAGKTWFLLQAWRRWSGTSLILAYNAQLAEAMKEHGAPCVTFHSLCSTCLDLARDDKQLDEAIARAEAGDLLPRDVPKATLLLVDEVQDVRRVYIRLLRALGLVDAETTVVLVGDELQLIYDFDAEFPADLAVMCHPETALSPDLEWEHIAVNTTYRLTPWIAQFVNHIFGTAIVALPREVEDALLPPVEVRVPKTIFSLFEALEDLFVEGNLPLVLSDRRKGNRPLRALVNALSRRGYPVRMHGEETEVGRTEVCFGTFWSAKGLQSSTVIVLMPEAVARNPAYVALTRASERLVVVVDPREPNAAVCHAALSLSTDPRAVVVRGDPKRVSYLTLPPEDTIATSLTKPERWARRPLPSINDHYVETTVPGTYDAETFVASVSGSRRDMTGPLLTMALVRSEWTATGRVRAMEDVLNPTRLDWDKRNDAILSGLESRIVSRGVSDDDLLARDLKAMARREYCSHGTRTRGSCAIVALACLAWDGYEHVMRQGLPTEDWTSHASVDTVLEFTDSILQGHTGVKFDVVLRKAPHHVRAHATADRTAFHFVWSATSDDVKEAAVRAALHGAGRCTLVELACGRQRVVAHVGGGSRVG